MNAPGLASRPATSPAVSEQYVPAGFVAQEGYTTASSGEVAVAVWERLAARVRVEVADAAAVRVGEEDTIVTCVGVWVQDSRTTFLLGVGVRDSSCKDFQAVLCTGGRGTPTAWRVTVAAAASRKINLVAMA